MENNRPQFEEAASGGVARRSALRGVLAISGLLILGCSREASTDKETERANEPKLPGTQLAAMTVYRDPSCGCCEAWADQARAAGYAVTLIDHPDMPALKRQHAVPGELHSCHTALIGGYAIEGHVPFDAVGRLLGDKPTDLAGLAVPGMPRGSPGMEMPDGAKDPFQVIAFSRSGRTSIWAAQGHSRAQPGA